jgi:hypothetical protein
MNVILEVAARPNCTHLFGGVLRIEVDSHRIVLETKDGRQTLVRTDYRTLRLDNDPGDWF